MTTHILSPTFTLLETIDRVTQIRAYPILILATVETLRVESENSYAFMQLYKFISGENKTQETHPMTVPVLFEKEQTISKMSFLIYPPPRQIPVPTNPNIKITVQKEQAYATIAFFGSATQADYIFHKNLLQKKLGERADSFNWDTLIFAVYTQPGTLQRERHEVWAAARPHVPSSMEVPPMFEGL